MSDAGEIESTTPSTLTATDEPAAARDGRNTKKRKLGVGALVFLGCFFLMVAIFATWVDRIALSSDTWSDTSTKALEQPAVRTALSQYLVDQMYANVDVPAVIAQALPPRAKPLAGAISAGAEPYLERAVAAGLARPRLVAIFRAANLKAHGQLMTILDGGGDHVSTEGGVVSINLTPIVGNFADRINAQTNGAVTLPPDAGNIVLLKNDQLKLAQDGTKLLRLMSIPLALAAIAILGIAVAISRDRRRTLRATAWGILVAGLILVLIRRVVGDALIDSLTTIPINREAGHAIWWVATDKLGSANLTTIVIGLLLLIGTWFAGPGRRASASRKAVTPYLRDPAIAYGTYAAIIVILLVWSPVNATRDLVTALVLIILGAIGVEALRRLSIRDFPDATDRHLGQSMSDQWDSLRHRRKAQPAAVESGRYADLEQLAALHDRGVLTDAEFAQQKAALLGT